MPSTLNIDMRPRAFDEVIGLEEQVKQIRAAIESGRMPRCWILSGPFGCGKTTLANIIAKAVQGPLFTGQVQVQDINAASIRGIDAMRRLAEAAATYPMPPSEFNVIILDEAHQLTKDSKQLLLKELESPTAPTVWIISTTNPEKLGAGILAGRGMHIKVQGMGPAERRTLVERAANHAEFSGDIVPFLTAATKAKLISPRKILMAFELYVAGASAFDAVGSTQFQDLPDHFDIAMGTVFGKWASAYSLPWIRKEQYPPVAEQLKKLEEQLKPPKEEEDAAPAAAPAPAAEGAEDVPVAETHEGKPEAARAILAIVAATFKGQLYLKENKDGCLVMKPKIEVASQALTFLANALPQDPANTALVWPCAVAALYRVNARMNGGA